MSEVLSAMRNIVPVLHNVHSVNRVVEFAKVVYGVGVEVCVISKAIGSAAQSGVPEAHKMAFRKGKAFLFVADVEDAIELMRPDVIYVVVPPDLTGEVFDASEAAKAVVEGKKVMLIYGGLEPGLTKREMGLGKPVTIDAIEADVGPVAYAAITLHSLVREVRKLLSQRG